MGQLFGFYYSRNAINSMVLVPAYQQELVIHMRGSHHSPPPVVWALCAQNPSL